MIQKPTYEQLELQIKTFEKQIENAKDSDQSTRDARRDYKRFLQFLPYPVLVRDANELITYLNQKSLPPIKIFYS